MIWDLLHPRKKRSSQRGAGRTPRRPEVGLPGWESRQAALMQGRNPYLVPEPSQLSLKDAVNARAPEGNHPTKVPSFARESSSVGGGTEAMLREPRSSGREFRPLFWIVAISAAAAIT